MTACDSGTGQVSCPQGKACSFLLWESQALGPKEEGKGKGEGEGGSGLPGGGGTRAGGWGVVQDDRGKGE